MNRVKFLESRVAELEERLSAGGANEILLDSLSFFDNQSKNLKIKDAVKLADFVAGENGCVLLNLDIVLNSTVVGSGKFLVYCNNSCVGELAFSVVAGENRLHFSTAVQAVKGIKNTLKLEVLQLVGATEIVLLSISGVLFGRGVSSGAVACRISACKKGSKLVEVIVDGEKVYTYLSNGVPAKSFGEFSYYGVGKRAGCVVTQTDNGERVHIVRLNSENYAFMSVGENISSEIALTDQKVDDVAIGVNGAEVLVFYIKNGQVYFKIFNGTRFGSERLVTRGNKRKFVELSVVGDGTELVVIATAEDGGNYLYGQVDVEKCFGGSGECITASISVEVA